MKDEYKVSLYKIEYENILISYFKKSYFLFYKSFWQNRRWH